MKSLWDFSRDEGSQTSRFCAMHTYHFSGYTPNSCSCKWEFLFINLKLLHSNECEIYKKMEVSHKHNIFILSFKKALILFPTKLAPPALQVESLPLTHQGNKESFHLCSSILYPLQPMKRMRGSPRWMTCPWWFYSPAEETRLWQSCITYRRF